MRLELQRNLFDIPDGVTYLNCANMSPQLRSVSAVGREAVANKATPWVLSSKEWFTGAERLRGLFAQIVNAHADAIAIVPSVSYGVAIAAANVPARRGQAIVVMDREFPSAVYAWRGVAARTGATLRTVGRTVGKTWTEALLEAIRDDTAVVAVPNCHWTDGGLVDLERIGEASRAVGSALVVDASQSLGAYPLDIERVRPDFLVTVGYKWLLGPYGLGYLYVAPRWQLDGMPIEQSWLTRAGAEDFSRLTEYADAYRSGARRFDMGEFPQFVLTPMAVAALEQILTWGVRGIKETLAPLTAQVAAGVEEMRGQTEPAENRVDHMIGLQLAGYPTPALMARLTERKIYVSVRGVTIRVAPHVYNDGADIGRLLDALVDVGGN